MGSCLFTTRHLYPNLLRKIKMKSIPKRKNPIIVAAASGLLSMTMGATNAYAVSEVTPEMTDVDVNAKTEKYDIIETKGAVAALTKYDVNETKF